MAFADPGRKPAIRKFLFALGLSVLLHGFVLVRFGLFSSMDTLAQSSPLNVTLIASLPESLAQPVSLRVEQVPEVVASARETPAAVTEKTTSPRPAKPVPEKQVITPSTSAAVAAPADVMTAKTEQKTGLPLGPSDPVNRVDIEFETFIGPDHHSAGRGHHRFVSNSSGGYAISINETVQETGARDSEGWKLEISGMIRKSSLFPIQFRMQGNLPERFMSLTQTRETSSSASREGRMPDNIMDRQSLLYSFMLRPPVMTGGIMLLSDGVLYTTYVYHFAGIESLSIPSMGAVSAVKLVMTSTGGSEVIELWLLSDRHYLPVKVRHTDRNGEITEQMVTSLDFS